MADALLVAYATKYGSTKEIAEVIGETLQAAGFEVSVSPAREVQSLEGYQAVVLGAPFYMYHWHKDARALLKRQRPALEKLPLAIFGLGPLADDEKEWEGANRQVDKILVKNKWLKPAATAAFGGRFDPKVLRFPHNLVPFLRSQPASDLRNWETIRAWAAEFGEVVKSGWSGDSDARRRVDAEEEARSKEGFSFGGIFGYLRD